MNTVNPLDQVEMTHEPTEAQVNRANRIMNAAVSTGQLSTGGMAWLKLATDPWHDNKVENFKGIPDQNIGNSVVMSVTQELAISKPASFGPGVWNTRISNYPLASNCPVSGYNQVGNTLTLNGTVAPGNLGPVCVSYSSGNSDFGEFDGGSSLQIPKEYLKGPFKVAGMGIEVVNTTAEIYQQGLCTVSVMNQSGDRSYNGVIYRDATNWNPATLFPVRSAPINLAEQILLPNTTQWHAKEGHYSVIQLTSMGTFPATAIPEYPNWTGSDFNSLPVTDPLATAVVMAPTLTSVSTDFGAKFVPTKPPGRVPCNTTTAMYTGLSEQTTLTLRVRWIIERFPNDNEPEIVVLATPTTPFDPLAMEIYSRLINKMPPAVMFKENNTQTWWKTALTTMADLISTGLLAMPHPLAKGAGAAIAAGRAILAPDQKVAKLKTSSKTPEQKAVKAVKKAVKEQKKIDKK